MRQDQWNRISKSLAQPRKSGTGKLPRLGKWNWRSRWYDKPAKGNDSTHTFSATMYRYVRNRFNELVYGEEEFKVRFERHAGGRDDCQAVMDMLCAVFNRFSALRCTQGLVNLSFSGSGLMEVVYVGTRQQWTLHTTGMAQRGDGEVFYTQGTFTSRDPFRSRRID